MKLPYDDSRQNFRWGGSKSIRKPPPNYFARGEQLRLFFLCTMLMLVLVMMNEARKPANWDWLWAGQANADAQVSAEPIDTRIETPDRTLPADGFHIDVPTAPDSTEPYGDYLPEITPELLQPIKDNTVMRAVENEAWTTMLTILDARSADEIESLSTGNIGFAQLFRQTDFYRGRLVTVRGTARRLEAIAARPNEAGFTQLFRWVLRPEGGNSPLIVYSLEKPSQLQPGDDLRERCSFTGFCFKRWAYPAGDGTRVAPVLLAKSPQWSPPRPTAVATLPSTSWLITAATGLICLSALIAFTVYRTSRMKNPAMDRLSTSSGDLDTNLSREVVLPSTRDALGAMEDTGSEPKS